MKTFRQILEAIQLILMSFFGQDTPKTTVQQIPPPNINIYITNNPVEKPKSS